MLDFGLYFFYVLLAISVIAAIVFPILHAIKSPKNLVHSLIGIGILVVVFGLSYALSGSEVTAKNLSLGVTETTSKLIGAGLIMFYFALIGSALVVIYSEINKAFK